MDWPHARRNILMTHSSTSLPCFTANLPGIGGHLKVEPADFVVEEIPAYEPSGTGEHLFLWIEKCDLPHDVLLRHLARSLDIPANDIGVAGIKDRRAVTRQYVSVPARCATQLCQVASNQVQVVRAALHGNKLRTGHLHGNRFEITVRDVAEDADVRVGPIVAAIHQFGFPNYYGEQRFGHDGGTLALGLDLLAGRKSPREIPYQKRKFLLRLALSSVQSDLFNKALALRLQNGLLHTVLEGDVLEVTESGGKFVAEDIVREQSRLEGGEVTITGPMFGVKMLAPRHEPAEREFRILSESGVNTADFDNFSQLMSGARRAFTVRPLHLAAEPVGRTMKFKFSLPSGVYATMLMRELMKGDEGIPRSCGDMRT
jgi:tRNA pseudouridine13 synthase